MTAKFSDEIQLSYYDPRGNGKIMASFMEMLRARVGKLLQAAVVAIDGKAPKTTGELAKHARNFMFQNGSMLYCWRGKCILVVIPPAPKPTIISPSGEPVYSNHKLVWRLIPL